jgi:GNAT superfamily N-acetyltransferase
MMSTIRFATIEDAPALTVMAQKFVAYGAHWSAFRIPAEEMQTNIESMLTAGTIKCLVAEVNGEIVGMIAFALVVAWFAPSVLLASELAWWVEERARGTTVAIRLVRAYEKWAIDNGAKLIAMSSITVDANDSVGNMLSRIGYEASEITHVKGT